MVHDDDRPGPRPARDAGDDEQYERRYEPQPPPVPGVRPAAGTPVTGPGLLGSPADPVVLPPAGPGDAPASAAQPPRRPPARGPLAPRARILAAAALILLVLGLTALVLAAR